MSEETRGALAVVAAYLGADESSRQPLADLFEEAGLAVEAARLRVKGETVYLLEHSVSYITDSLDPRCTEGAIEAFFDKRSFASAAEARAFCAGVATTNSLFDPDDPTWVIATRDRAGAVNGVKELIEWVGPGGGKEEEEEEAAAEEEPLDAAPAAVPPRAGDVVALVFGVRETRGVVVEDRGPIGVGGRNLYRVRLDAAPDEEPVFIELPADELWFPPLGSPAEG